MRVTALLLILFLNTCQSICPQGTYTVGDTCNNCPVRCSECTSIEKCSKCQSPCGFYYDDCLEYCPSFTFPQINEKQGHIECLTPQAILSSLQTKVIFPFDTVRNYSQRPADLLVSPLMSFNDTALIIGWMLISKGNSTLNGSLFEVYEHSTTLTAKIGLKTEGMYATFLDRETPTIEITTGVWLPFSLQIYPKIEMKYSRFHGISIMNADQHVHHLIFLGKSIKGFSMAVRGVYSIHTRNQLISQLDMHYGVDKLLFNVDYLPPMIINRTSTFNLTFVAEENVYTLRFRYNFTNLTNEDVLKPCKLFNMADSYGNTLAFAHVLLTKNLSQVCNPINCRDSYLVLGSNELTMHFFIDREQNGLLMFYDSFKQFEKFPFSSENIKIQFGGGKSCSFLPYNLQVYHGGAGLISVNGNECSKRDIFQEICLDCPPGYDYILFTPPFCQKKVMTSSNQPLNLTKPQEPDLPFCKVKAQWKCMKCKEGYTLAKVDWMEICVKECPLNMFPLFEDGNYICKKCSLPNCKLCWNSTICLECKEGFFLDEDKCVVECKEKFYFETDCVSICPVGTFLQDRRCKRCSPGCFKCVSPNSCIHCQENKGLILYNGSCYNRTCFIDKTNDCPNCEFPCVQCAFNPRPDFKDLIICLQCAEGYSLYEGICVKECPVGFQQIQDRCKECSYYINSSNGTQCFEKVCPYGYSSSGQRTCKKCPNNCLTCSQNQFFIEDTCLECDHQTILSHGRCKKICPKSHYSHQLECRLGNRRCDRGIEPCEKCLKDDIYYDLEQHSQTCQICKVKIPFSLRMQFSFLSGPLSIEHIPILTKMHQGFIVTKEETCIPCNKNCLNCTIEGKCRTCANGYFLTEDGICLERCPKGYFGNNDRCVKCSEYCLACLDLERCIECFSDLALRKGYCFKAKKLSIYRYYQLRLTDNYLLQLKTKTWDPEVQGHLWVGIEYIVEDVDCPNQLEIGAENDLISIGSRIAAQNCFETSLLQGNLCHKSCFLCSYDWQTDSQKCLQCFPLMSNAIIQGNRCRCPEDLPYYDHTSLKCVAACPSGVLIIPETRECVATCLTLSLFAEDYFFYQWEDKCLRMCPPGYNAEFDLDSNDVVRCVPQKTYELYRQLYLAFESVNETSLRCSLRDSALIYKIPRGNLQFNNETISLFKDYLHRLSEEKNLHDIVFQDRSFLIISSFLQISNISKELDIDLVLKFLINMGYGCNDYNHPYYLIEVIDSILAELPDPLEKNILFSQLFDSLNQCFENLQQGDLGKHQLVYTGSRLTCQAFPVRQSMTSQHYFLEQLYSRIEITVDSISREPLNILTCNFSGNSPEKGQSYYYQVGIFSAYDTRKWWETKIDIVLTAKPNEIRLYLWNMTSWGQSSSIMAEFTPISYNKSIIYLISASKGEPEDPYNQKQKQRSDVVLFLAIMGLVLTIFYMIYFIYLRFSDAINQTQKEKNQDAEESESVMELQKIEEIH